VIPGCEYAQSSPFAAPTGEYKVLSCKDVSAVKVNDVAFCDSKTILLGALSGYDKAGVRFKGVNSDLFSATCKEPAACTRDQISSPRLSPGQTLLTNIELIQNSGGTLKINIHRQLIKFFAPSGEIQDTKFEIVAKIQN
jgi:hypothetical protein